MSALPILFLATIQPQASSQQSHAGWLWGGIVISLLLGIASIGLTVIRTKMINKRMKRIDLLINEQFSNQIDSTINERVHGWKKEIDDFKIKIESGDLEKRILAFEVEKLKKQLSDLASHPQSQLSVTPLPFSPSLNQSATDAPISASLISHPQSVEPIRPQVPERVQETLAVHDQAVIDWKTQRTVSSKLEDFASAIELDNRNIIREQSDSELNITKESEDALVRRELGHRTQLEEVSGGGSYYRLSEGGRSWLFPTPLTLKMIARNRPSKGLFQYESDSTLMPRIKKPAEIQSISDKHWQVVEMGTIIIPA